MVTVRRFARELHLQKPSTFSASTVTVKSVQIGCRKFGAAEQKSAFRLAGDIRDAIQQLGSSIQNCLDFTIEFCFRIDCMIPAVHSSLATRSSSKEWRHIWPTCKRGFGGDLLGACCKLKIAIEEVQIPHRKRPAGESQVYRPEKMLGIMVRNGLGLLKLRLAEGAAEPNEKLSRI